jgi:3-oxoadipate enol-lactonase
VRIVFLHGIGGLAVGFEPHVAYFKSRGFNALAYNQPGYGQEPLTLPYTFETIAQSLMAKLGSQGALDVPTILVGHSMGGMLAQTVAIMNATAVERLNLLGVVLAHTSPAFGNNDGQFQQRFVADRVAPLDAGKSMLDVAQKLVPSMVGPACDTNLQQNMITMMSQVAASTYRAALGALVQFDARPHLSRLSMPVLCLAAEHDKTAPPAVLEKLAAKLLHGAYECLPDLGHLAPLENPLVFCSIVEKFIQTQVNQGLSR